MNYKRGKGSSSHSATKKSTKTHSKSPLMIGLLIVCLVVFVCSNFVYTGISGKQNLLNKVGILQAGENGGENNENSDKTHFHVVESVDEFKQKSHYIIVAYNKKEGKFYGLAPDKDGYQYELPISSIDELKNGLDVDNDKVNTESYIFTCSSEGTKENNTYISGTKFKTNVKDDDGNTLALKLGTSNRMPYPVFDKSTGGLELTDVNTSEDGIHWWTINKSGGGQLFYYPYFTGEHEFDAPGNTNSYFSPTSTEIYCRYDWNLDVRVYDWSTIKYYKNIVTETDGEKRWTTEEKLFPANSFLEDELKLYVNLDDFYSWRYIGLTDFVILSDYKEDESQNNEITFTKVEQYGDLLQSYIDTDDHESSRKMAFVYVDSEGNRHVLGDEANTVTESIGEDNSKIIKTAQKNSIIMCNALRG